MMGMHDGNCSFQSFPLYFTAAEKNFLSQRLIFETVMCLQQHQDTFVTATPQNRLYRYIPRCKYSGEAMMCRLALSLEQHLVNKVAFTDGSSSCLANCVV